MSKFLLTVASGATDKRRRTVRPAHRRPKQIGNYSEIIERNIGKNSPLKLERGLNALWTQGGLMYPLPIR